MKPYPEYKETGLAWLPKIPKHWELNRGKNLFIKANRPVSDNADVVTCFRDGVVTLRKNRRLTGFTESIKEIGYQGIRTGDLVIHVMDAFAGAIGVSDSDGKGTPVYSVCIAKKPAMTNNYYFAHLVRVMAKTGYIQSLYRGIRERSSDFRFEVFANQILPVPPVDEQAQIVRYLDAMTATINKLIRAKKKQIALLQEQKQAIINQAVTKGLDPHAEMKDSGIDWLGKIPKHWRLKRLGHFSSFQNGISAPGKYFGHGFPFMGYGEVYNYYELPQTLTELAQSTSEEQRRYSILAGDVFFTRTSETIEEIAFSSVCLKTIPQATFSGFLIRVRPQPENIFPRYAKYYFRSQCVRNYFVKEMNLVTRASLSQRLLRNLPVLLPNLSEQKEIAAYLEKKCSELAFIIAQCEKEITLATEYKNSLILSAVTGKIDLRNTKVEFVASDDQPIKDDSDLEADEESEPISTEGNEG